MAGTGSANHLANEMLNLMSGIRTIQVPYKGAGPALASRDILDKFAAQGSTPLTSSPEQFAKLMREESARYAQVIKAANIRLD